MSRPPTSIVVPFFCAACALSACSSAPASPPTGEPVPEASVAPPEAEAPSPAVEAGAPEEDAAPLPPPGDDGATGAPDTGLPSPGPDSGGAGGGPDDGAVATVDAGGISSSDASTSLGGPYTCTLVFGILATQQFWGDFEKLVNPAKWELIWVHSGFVELWANPNDPIWQTAITTPCAQNSKTPDRIIFVALNFNFMTLAEWLPPLTAAAKNLQTKYPSARRIELGTFVRAPNNMPCPQA